MNKEILRLAIPNIISNISAPLLSTVDTALMGRFSELHIGAVGLGAMIFNFIYWNFGFLRMGTTGMTAQAFGKQDNLAITNTLGRAVFVVLMIAVLLLTGQWVIGESAIFLMNASEEQMPLIREYFYIRIWAAPASLALYAFMGWFFGMQNALYPLIITIVINVVNIVLNFLFVFYFGMEIEGVAWSTVIAQYTGLLLAIGLFWWKYRSFLQYYQRSAVLAWDELKGFLLINRDIFIRTVGLTVAFGFFYSQSAIGGDLILAANVILLQLLNWMSYGVDGFAFAAESLVGKYYGAGDAAKAKRAIRVSFTWGMGFAVLFSLCYALLGYQIICLFTNQADVIAVSMGFLFWMVLFPILATPCYIWDGIFVGLTASKSMRNSMALAFVLYFIAHFALNGYGNHGLWAALLLFMIARAVFQYWLYIKKGLALN